MAACLAAWAGAAGRPPAQGNDLKAAAAAAIGADAVRGVGYYYRPGFSTFRELQMGVYQAPAGRAYVYLSIVYADGREGAGEFYLDTDEFEELWTALNDDGVLDLPGASPDYGAGPPPTDTVAFAVAARDGDRANIFTARDPGALDDPRYGRIVARLDGVVQDYEDELKAK